LAGPVDLLPLLPEELACLMPEEPPYRGAQVFKWVHARGVTSFDAMTDLPLALRASLAEKYMISRLEPVEVLRGADATRKLIFDAGNGRPFTSVLMPGPDRVTLCVSSQVGCRMGCAFCLTGRMRFHRNLKAAEIIGQVHAAARILSVEGGPRSRISNVVFMGMGEPLDNLEEVLRAVRVITHRLGLRVAPRRTTVSTVGLVPAMRQFLQAGTGASLAVSLCATTDEARNRVVPVGRRYPIGSLLDTLASMPPPHGHHYTIEYQLIPGVGASVEDARRLSRMLARFPSKVNLIPFNPWPLAPFREPTQAEVEAFRAVLAAKHHSVTVRYSRGRDIGAACGQLGPASNEKGEATGE